MDTEEFIEKGTAAWNDRDRDGFLALCDENTELSAPGGVSGKGLEFAAMFWSGWQDAFPDNHITIKAIVGEGSEGAEESVFEGTHIGVLRGPAAEVAPTGRHVSVPFAGLHTVRNDKWVSFRVYFDQVELLTQLGLMPAPPQHKRLAPSSSGSSTPSRSSRWPPSRLLAPCRGHPTAAWLTASTQSELGARRGDRQPKFGSPRS